MKKKAAPTFALLHVKRLLAVRNPENGVCFDISMRDWAEVLWAVRVHPSPSTPRRGNSFMSAHRILPRPRIEEWLAELRLA